MFNTYRYLTDKTKLVVGQDKGKLEDRIRLAVAEGDTEFAGRRYDAALEHYLEAYGLCVTYLHPQFPVGPLVANPAPYLGLSLMAELTDAVALNAKFRHVDGLPPTVAPFEPPPAVTKIVDQNVSGFVSTPSRADLLFENGLNLLTIGEFTGAEEQLKAAQRSNRGQDKELSARIVLAQGAAQLGLRRIDEARKSVTSATAAFKELGSTFSEYIAGVNTGLFDLREGEPATPTAQGLSARSPRVPRADAEAVAITGHGIPLGTGLFGDLPLVSEVRSPTKPVPMVDETNEFVVPFKEGVVTLDLAAGEKTEQATSYRVMTGTSSVVLDLTKGAQDLVTLLYEPRATVTNVVELWPAFVLPETFLAYVPHLHGYVLPMNIADCYAGLGRRTQAVDYYLKALDYPYLNIALEGAQVWLKAARAIVDEADHLFRSERIEAARDMYETVVSSAGSVPSNTTLYQHTAFAPMRQLATDALTAIDAGAVFTPAPMVGAVVARARAQLIKIEAGLNWLGLAPDTVPIWSFDFLQSTARYFAGHAIQAWRQYISYRSAAEQEELTQRELEQAIVMNEYAEAAQQARVDLAESQVDVSVALLEGALLHRDNLVEQRDQFNTDGWVIAELNRFQAWYSNAGNDTTFAAGHWDWGSGNELSIGETTGQDAIDQVMRLRNRLSHEMQIDNFNRQIAEANSQIDVAERQVAVAQAQVEVAGYELAAAAQRTEFARQNLEFFEQQEFTPDLWHALADALGEVAADYLAMGIYAAFLMERAYNTENDRDLRRIRFDYVDVGGAAELTAGDSLLLDIDSFTNDLLMNVKGRHNQVRHVISLADFAPQAFFEFRDTGVLEFTVPIDEIERHYPGTYLHRIQGIEVEIEGLLVPEGINGTLEHLGISSWRRSDGTVQSRVSAPESLVLSGFDLRRDSALFRVDPGRLRVFENSGSAGSWRLRVPPGSNDVDYASIFDVRIVLYFLCLHDARLEAQIRAAMPTTGEAAQAFSARLHAPDQYFAFGPDPGSDTIRFTLDPRAFPYNQQHLRIAEIGVSVLRSEGQKPAVAFGGVDLDVTLGGSTRSGTTTADGVVASDRGGGALGGFAGEPVGDVEVTFTGPDAQRGEVADVHLFLTYRYDVR
jgi:tetratricopeptide (TPR) repeat protein